MKDDHKDYAIAKCAIITMCMLMSVATITTIIKTKQLRDSPIFCSVGYAISTNFIENLVVFYVHDFPSAIVGDDLMDQYHGFIAFIAMTKWFAHMMNLLTMTAYYIVLLYDYEWFQKVRQYRFTAMMINTIVGALFAFPYVFSEFYGFDFTLESLSWSHTNSESMNFTGSHFKASAIIYASISWMFLVILTIITAAAGTVMFIFIYRARKRSSHPTTSHKSFQILENEIMLISAFFGITLAYYFPVLSFNLTPLWYSEHFHSLYEVLDIFEDLVENTKWKLYAFSSSRFRAALARTILRRKGAKVKPLKIFVTTRV